MRALVLLLLLACSCFGYGTNRVPNSSFECGTGRGWASWHTADNTFLGEKYFITEQLTNDAWHGKYAYKMVPGEDLICRSFWLTAGTYIVSRYMKTDNGSSQGLNYAGLMRTTNISAFVYLPRENVSGSWTRYWLTNVVPENDFYVLQMGTGGPAGVLVDGIQVELASDVPTTYSPAAEIEMGIGVKGVYSMWFAGQTPSFDLMFRNEGAQTNIRAQYIIRDTWNSNVTSLTRTYVLPAGTNTNVVINLPTNTVSGLPLTGWFRVVTRLAEITDSYDEVKTIVYPFASNTVGHATNDWLGGHPHSSAYMSKRESLTGRRMARNLSVNNQNTRWWDGNPVADFEHTRGSIVFSPEGSYTNWFNNGLIGLGCITPDDGEWPPWAVMTDTPAQVNTTNAMFPYVGMWDGMAWSNACYQAVRTNKQHIKYWEIGPNEPAQSGPQGFGPEPSTDFPFVGATNLPVNVRVWTNYARVLKYGIDGVTNADPTAKIIAIAGASGNGDWAWAVWTNLTADIQSWIYAVSNHMYTDDQAQDPNVPFYIGITTGANHPMGWMDRFKGVRPVWNTECSAVGVDYFLGMNELFRHDWWNDFEAAGFAEAVRSEQSNRMLTEPIRLISTILRHIGFGYSKFFYYDTRYFNDSSFTWVNPGFFSSQAWISFSYPADYMEVDRPELVAASVATHFIHAPGYGAISNTTAPYAVGMEMYLFDGAKSGPWANKFVVAGWSADRTNRTVYFTNSNFAQYDFMGNLIQTNMLTARMTRAPSYFASGTLSGTQLSNTFRFATNTLDPDVLAPQISIDIAPTGPWSGDTNRQFVKWTAIDDVAVAFASGQDPGYYQSQSKTNVVYSWKLNSATYTTPSQSNHVWLSHIPAGTNTFWVRAWDKSGNEAEVSYPFVPIDDPLLPPTNLRIHGTVHIGTATVVP